MLGMQDALHGLTVMMTAGGPGGSETRPFEWDTRSDGYPLISRCFDNGQTTLDLHLVSFDRKALDPDLATVPADYARQELPDLGGKGRRKKR